MPFQTINPHNEELIAEFPYISDSELNDKIEEAHQVYIKWKRTSFSERSGMISLVAEDLIRNKSEYGRIITQEMGKPLLQSMAEVEKCALCCMYYAANAEKFLASRQYPTDYSQSEVHFEPLGIIYAIMPWNFPLWQVFRCAIPAIIAGNSILLKHAENVPQSALIIQKVFENAGAPVGLFTNLFINHKQSDLVIEHKFVKGTSLTGSERAGGHVAALAGKNIKRTVLELGGSDPFIILSDADIDIASKMGCISRMQNNGQSCIAAKRFIVVKEIAEVFLEKFVSDIKTLKIGDPMDDDNYMGPLARRDLVDTLEKQVNSTIKLGGKVLTGGKKMEGKGYYFEPTVLIDIPIISPAYSEELFGPVASVFIVENEQEAIALANDTDFGLGASLWTADIQKALQISKEIQSGSVYINTIVKSDPGIPFGGIKHSGFGRELSDFGIHEFVNTKTICIA